jgi:ABC-2 type transport system ATP-binding protein
MRLSVRDLRKTYGAFTLDVPALDVPSGTTLGLVGGNGAGKTTLLRLVLDLLAPDAGTVRLDGDDVATTSAWKARTGAYLDDGFLIDFLTADEFLSFTAEVYGLAGAAYDEALAPYRDFYVDEPLGRTTKYLRALSMGNRKRAGLIAAMLHDPRLLLLDEPFASLDPRSQLQLRRYLKQHAARGATVVVSSHDLTHVTDVCERIVVLDGGEVVRDEATTDTTRADLEAFFGRELDATG